MRLAVALLFVAVTGVPAFAQQKPSTSDEVLRQRILLQERFNKGWDVQAENARDRIEPRCKAEARKRYSAIHPLKRRAFVKDCVKRARR